MKARHPELGLPIDTGVGEKLNSRDSTEQRTGDIIRDRQSLVQ